MEYIENKLICIAQQYSLTTTILNNNNRTRTKAIEQSTYIYCIMYIYCIVCNV